MTKSGEDEKKNSDSSKGAKRVQGAWAAGTLLMVAREEANDLKFPGGKQACVSLQLELLYQPQSDFWQGTERGNDWDIILDAMIKTKDKIAKIQEAAALNNNKRGLWE